MKKYLLTITALLITASSCLAQEDDLTRRWSLSFGPKTMCGIASAHTLADADVVYDYGELALDFSLWNISNRIDLGPYATVFGCQLLPHPSGVLEFGLGAQLGVGGHFHLLSDHMSPSNRWDLALNASLGAQLTKFLPVDFVAGISLSAIWYPVEKWGIMLETGLNGILGGNWEHFSLPSNSILRLGVSHRF